MNIDDFLEAVASEPPRVVSRTVRTVLPEALAAARKRGGILLEAFLALPATMETREVEYRHIVGPPASIGAVEQWKKQHPAHSLPAELTDLLGRFNGVHLWADSLWGRAYVGLSPIEEWQLARRRFYDDTPDPILYDDRFVLISYHQDNSFHAVADLASGTYHLFDTTGSAELSLIAEDVGGLLDWIWSSRIDPTAESGAPR